MKLRGVKEGGIEERAFQIVIRVCKDPDQDQKTLQKNWSLSFILLTVSFLLNQLYNLISPFSFTPDFLKESPHTCRSESLYLYMSLYSAILLKLVLVESPVTITYPYSLTILWFSALKVLKLLTQMTILSFIFQERSFLEVRYMEVIFGGILLMMIRYIHTMSSER